MSYRKNRDLYNDIYDSHEYENYRKKKGVDVIIEESNPPAIEYSDNPAADDLEESIAETVEAPNVPNKQVDLKEEFVEKQEPLINGNTNYIYDESRNSKDVGSDIDILKYLIEISKKRRKE